jgi:hypothetical protein
MSLVRRFKAGIEFQLALELAKVEEGVVIIGVNGSTKVSRMYHC